MDEEKRIHKKKERKERKEKKRESKEERKEKREKRKEKREKRKEKREEEQTSQFTTTTHIENVSNKRERKNKQQQMAKEKVVVTCVRNVGADEKRCLKIDVFGYFWECLFCFFLWVVRWWMELDVF